MSQTNRRLGYPPDARLLIINADDFGMCHAVNAAIIDALQTGIVRSTTLMLPCPWALHGINFLKAHSDVAFGVHLTIVSEWDVYRWGSIRRREQVTSLMDDTGYFHNFAQIHQRLAQISLTELELEFRAQIETVLATGLNPTHLDWHSLRLSGGDPISELMFHLAQEYRLAMRIRGQSWIAEVQRQGFPCNDFDFLDSYHLDPSTKFLRYAELLRELPEGLSEWAIHPGLDNAELRTIDPNGALVRQSDFDFFTSSQAKNLIEAEGIILLDYRIVQRAWQLNS